MLYFAAFAKKKPTSASVRTNAGSRLKSCERHIVPFLALSLAFGYLKHVIF